MASAKEVKLTSKNDCSDLNKRSTDMHLLPNLYFNVSTTVFYFNKYVSVDYSKGW